MTPTDVMLRVIGAVILAVVVAGVALACWCAAGEPRDDA